MENRFGFKDLVLSLLLVMVIVIVVLGMYQLDRQWKVLQELGSKSDEQARVLGLIQRRLNSQSFAANDPHSTTNTTQPSAGETFPHGDPFEAMKEAESHPDFSLGDWIIDNTGAKVKNITYPIAGDLYADWIAARVCEGLIYRDPMTLEFRPQLARDWKISSDGMVYTFELRKGVLFSDGVPMTADDVIFSFEFLMNPKINCPRSRAYLEKIKSVVKTGPDEVTFTMATPYFNSLELCGTLNIIPRHFFTQFAPEEVNTNPGLLLGTGPYRMPDPKSWRPGTKIELTRNELYWGEPATFDRCIFREVEDETAEETMFGNRELDVFAPQPEQFLKMLDDPTTTDHANHFEVESPMNGYGYIAWNEKPKNGKPIFADRRVRRAMTMLTDRQRICHETYHDFAKPTSGPFAMNSPQADPSIKPLPYDVSAAKALLAEAGWEARDNSGVLKNSSGEPLRFRLTYPNGSATYERVVLFLKDSYAQAGVTLEQDPEDWPVVQKKLDSRDFDAITLRWGGSLESDLYQEFDSSQMADQGDNFMSYANPKLDAIVRKARETVDTPKRNELWHQAHAILHEDQPYTFMYSNLSLRFVDKRIQNIKPSKVGLNYVYLYAMPNPWYVPAKLQHYKSK